MNFMIDFYYKAKNCLRYMFLFPNKYLIFTRNKTFKNKNEMCIDFLKNYF